MNANQLHPKAIQSVKVVIQDKLNPQNRYALFFESMGDAAKGIESFDIDKVHLSLFRTPPGLEYVSNWEGDPKPGDVYKMEEVRAGHLYSKRFFLCLQSMQTRNDSTPTGVHMAYFQAVLSIKPSSVYPDFGHHGLTVEVRDVDDSGEVVVSIPPKFATYVSLPRELRTSLSAILDHYIDTFASLYSTEFLNTAPATDGEEKTECCCSGDHTCEDDCKCHHS